MALNSGTQSNLLESRGGIGVLKTFSFRDDFKFNLFKYEKGKYNKSGVIDEIEIDCKEMLEAFKQF